MVVVFYDAYTILNKVYHGEYLKEALSDTVIDEKTRALTTKICYGVLDKDIELSYYINSLTEKSPKAVIRTILKISMYAVKYLEKKEYAVTTSAVELTKKLGKGGASGFVNAFMRKFIGSNFTMPKDETERISVEYSYPLFAVKRLIEDYGKDLAIEIISKENTRQTVVFYETDGEDYLKSHDIKYEKTPFENVFTVENFVRNKDYDSGIYTFQALGSVAICEGVKPVENLLDCCAAPGGKSIRLSFKCKNVYAEEIYPHRVNLIKSYAFRMKRENLNISESDATVYKKEYEGKFDAVLCDSPCSGIGVIKDNPDMILNKGEENVSALNELQLKILENVSKYVKKGGYLYYSTCSVFKSENIDIVKKFLSKNVNYKIEKADTELNHIDLDGTIQFLPDGKGLNGFYFAKLKRVE